jgi:hypothetical protein
MSGFVEAQASQNELVAITGVLSLACIIGAVFARKQAPAVSVGLATALTIGAITFIISSHEGPQGVPLLVLMAASVGLAGAGLTSALLLPAQVTTETLRRAAAATAATAPIMGLVVLLSIQHACPLYVGRGSGFCNYDNQDQLGGWTAAAAVIIGLDMLLIALLLWITAMRSSQSDLHPGEHAGVFAGHRS